MLGLWAATDGDILVSADPGVLQEIGVLQFDFEDFAVFPSPNWAAEFLRSALNYRATLVDTDFRDHHPELVVGEGEFQRGNANNDGSINIADPIFTLEYLFSMGSDIPCFDAADANNDSSVNIADAVFTLGFLFSMGPPFPPPYPACGPDAGPIDLLECLSSTCQP